MGVSKCPKKVMASANYIGDANSWWLVDTGTGFCGGALYLHTLLGAYRVYTWHFCLLS